MSTQSSDTKNFTRGGQITLHNLRMFTQVMDKVMLSAGLVFLLVTSIMAWGLTSEYERYFFGQYVWANTLPIIDSNASTQFIQPNGNKMIVKYTDIAHSDLAKAVMKNVSRKALFSLIVGLLSGMLTVNLISRWLRKQGSSQAESRVIKGDEFVSPETLKKIIIKNNSASDLVLAGLPLIKNQETKHFFFHGTTGSGKSNAIKELLDQIRRRGDRAIIYDMSCTFLEEFYLKGHDKLLNPMDVRGESWHLWSECRDSADFDSVAAAQIPMPLSTQDPFWINAARTIFSAAAFEMRKDPNRNILKLLRYLLTSDLERMESYLRGTEAETLTSRKTEKTAISIKSVLATYLKSMKYITEGDNPFSIRQWIKNEKGRNWLFITSLDDRHETLRPLITMWMDIVVNSLMSLPQSQKRRIWLVLDELSSLNKLPYLRKTLAKARKFGGCVVIGLQNFAELEEEYGSKGARSISSLLNTRYFFREPDPDLAKWSADNFGETIIKEVREGISYGANTLRDGISINWVETRKPLVSCSEIMTLGDLHAYVRLPGKFPVTNVNFQYREREIRNNGLIQRKIDVEQMKEVEELIDKCEKEGEALKKEEEKTESIKNKNNKKYKKKKITEIKEKNKEKTKLEEILPEHDLDEV